jgi:hypothetical protein
MEKSLSMIPAQQPVMYQQAAQPMPMPQANIGQPLHQITSGKSNRGWMVAGGVHFVFMFSLFFYALVRAFFEPAPDYYDETSEFANQLFYSMQMSNYFFFFPTFAITLVAVLSAMNVGCNKLAAIVLPPLSQVGALLLWSLIAAAVSPEDSFLEAWEMVFGEDFFEEVIPLVVSQIILCAGIVGLISLNSDE